MITKPSGEEVFIKLIDDTSSGQIVDLYQFEHRVKLLYGRVMRARSFQYRNLPEVKELKDVPYPVKIECLIADPSALRFMDERKLVIPFLKNKTPFTRNAMMT